MDPARLKATYQKLQTLDESLAYRVRPRPGGLHRPTPEQLKEQLNDLSHYTLELKEIVRDLIQAIAAKNPAASG